MKFLSRIGFILAVVMLVSPALADDTASRYDLARQMHELRPVSAQVHDAIEEYAKLQPPEQREAFKLTMRKILNLSAVEKISIDAYAEIFTEQELAAMVAYYSSPEAQSAAQKFDLYAEKVYPEITKLLDKALIRAKTEGQ